MEKSAESEELRDTIKEKPVIFDKELKQLLKTCEQIQHSVSNSHEKDSRTLQMENRIKSWLFTVKINFQSKKFWKLSRFGRFATIVARRTHGNDIERPNESGKNSGMAKGDRDDSSEQSERSDGRWGFGELLEGQTGPGTGREGETSRTDGENWETSEE